MKPQLWGGEGVSHGTLALHYPMLWGAGEECGQEGLPQ